MHTFNNRIKPVCVCELEASLLENYCHVFVVVEVEVRWY